MNPDQKAWVDVPSALKGTYKNLYTGQIIKLHDKIYFEDDLFMILQKESI